MKNNNDDKRILLATLLSTILIVGWMKYYGGKTLPKSQKN
jgi:hypothetical protein